MELAPITVSCLLRTSPAEAGGTGLSCAVSDAHSVATHSKIWKESDQVGLLIAVALNFIVHETVHNHATNLAEPTITIFFSHNHHFLLTFKIHSCLRRLGAVEYHQIFK